MAGNPYRGCTWDISGKWEMFYLDGHSERMHYDGLRNEPYVISIQRTDAVLKTRYITGTIFVITPVTSVSYGIFHRAFVDVNDNRSVIMELAEGFVDSAGRNMYFKNKQLQHSFSKVYPTRAFVSDQVNLEGGWIKQDGSRVKIHDFHRLGGGSSGSQGGGYPMTLAPGFAYWYNDDSHAVPQMRLSTTLFMDETLPFEQQAFDTTSKFLQLGMYGEVALGGEYIVVKSPADGRPIFTFRRVVEYPLPQVNLLPSPTTIALSGEDQLRAIHEASANALGTTTTTTTTTVMPFVPPHWPPFAPDFAPSDFPPGQIPPYPFPGPVPVPPSPPFGWPFPLPPSAPKSEDEQKKLYDLYNSYGLFNRGVMPNNTFTAPLIPKGGDGLYNLDPRLEIDPYDFETMPNLAAASRLPVSIPHKLPSGDSYEAENSQLVGPPLRTATPSPNMFDSRRDGGARQDSVFHRGLAADLSRHERLRDEALLFGAGDRLRALEYPEKAETDQSAVASRRRLADASGVSFTYPEPPASPSKFEQCHVSQKGRRLLREEPADDPSENRASEFSSHNRASPLWEKKSQSGLKPVGVVDAEEFAEASLRKLEGAKRQAEGIGGGFKTSFDDLKKLIPISSDNPLVQMAANTLDGRRSGEQATTGGRGLFEQTDFFGLDTTALSPYDWLWRASARRLGDAERVRDEALMKRFGKRNNRQGGGPGQTRSA